MCPRYTADKVKQEFVWDGKHDVSLVFENDARVKIELLKLDDSDDPLPDAVFHVVKDGQIIATEKTDSSGRIVVPNVTEGMYAFIEKSVPGGRYVAAVYSEDDYGSPRMDSHWARLGDKITLRHVEEYEYYNPNTGH